MAVNNWVDAVVTQSLWSVSLEWGAASQSTSRQRVSHAAKLKACQHSQLSWSGVVGEAVVIALRTWKVVISENWSWQITKIMVARFNICMVPDTPSCPQATKFRIPPKLLRAPEEPLVVRQMINCGRNPNWKYRKMITDMLRTVVHQLRLREATPEGERESVEIEIPSY